MDEICREVLKIIIPTQEERKLVLKVAENVKKRVSTEAKDSGLDADVIIGGSVAKDTWLRCEADIDLFMRVPISLTPKDLEQICLNVARKATRGWKQRERFAEHPYLEAYVKGIRVNIVPCYKVRAGEWISAADRTPFHTDYVKEKLDERAKNDVRLLKRFMQGICTYGAEIKIGGFSGYLSELLVINYGSFSNTIEEASRWKKGWVIDVENHYEGQDEEAKNIFGDPLIVVDPVDKGRNVAAAVSQQKLNEFVAASRIFLDNPMKQFFYPPETIPIEPYRLKEVIEFRGTDMIFVVFRGASSVPDILWGQLFKSLKSLRRLLKEHAFKIVKTLTWSDERSMHVFLFELESKALSTSKRHVGPPVEFKDSANFLKKYLEAEQTVSGPWIEDGHWIVEVRREHANAISLLRKKLEDGGRSIGIANGLVGSIRRSCKVLANDEILDFYSSKPSFARFLTEFIKGKPKWLG